MSVFTDPGTSEATKGAVHGALFTLATLCAVYNGCAWLLRREPHLARNAAIYGALMAYEVVNVRHHCRRRPASDRL